MTLIKNTWRGDIGLGKAYWLLGVGGNIIFAVLIQITQLASNQPLLVVVTILALAYTIFVSIVIWRSATKHNGLKVWANAAKTLVGISWAGLFVGLAYVTGDNKIGDFGFASRPETLLTINDPHPFLSIAECELLEMRKSSEPNAALSYKLIKEACPTIVFQSPSWQEWASKNVNAENLRNAIGAGATTLQVIDSFTRMAMDFNSYNRSLPYTSRSVCIKEQSQGAKNNLHQVFLVKLAKTYCTEIVGQRVFRETGTLGQPERLKGLRGGGDTFDYESIIRVGIKKGIVQD